VSKLFGNSTGFEKPPSTMTALASSSWPPPSPHPLLTLKMPSQTPKEYNSFKPTPACTHWCIICIPQDYGTTAYIAAPSKPTIKSPVITTQQSQHDVISPLTLHHDKHNAAGSLTLTPKCPPSCIIQTLCEYGTATSAAAPAPIKPRIAHHAIMMQQSQHGKVFQSKLDSASNTEDPTSLPCWYMQHSQSEDDQLADGTHHLPLEDHTTSPDYPNSQLHDPNPPANYVILSRTVLHTHRKDLKWVALV